MSQGACVPPPGPGPAAWTLSDTDRLFSKIFKAQLSLFVCFVFGGIDVAGKTSGEETEAVSDRKELFTVGSRSTSSSAKLV